MLVFDNNKKERISIRIKKGTESERRKAKLALKAK